MSTGEFVYGEERRREKRESVSPPQPISDSLWLVSHRSPTLASISQQTLSVDACTENNFKPNKRTLNRTPPSQRASQISPQPPWNRPLLSRSTSSLHLASIIFTFPALYRDPWRKNCSFISSRDQKIRQSEMWVVFESRSKTEKTDSMRKVHGCVEVNSKGGTNRKTRKVGRKK